MQTAKAAYASSVDVCCLLEHLVSSRQMRTCTLDYDDNAVSSNISRSMVVRESDNADVLQAEARKAVAQGRELRDAQVSADNYQLMQNTTSSFTVKNKLEVQRQPQLNVISRRVTDAQVSAREERELIERNVGDHVAKVAQDEVAVVKKNADTLEVKRIKLVRCKLCSGRSAASRRHRRSLLIHSNHPTPIKSGLLI